MEDLEAYAQAVLGSLREDPPRSKDAVQVRKQRLAKAHGLSGVPRDSELLQRLPDADREALEGFLRKKPTRSASGVAIIAVMSSPARCPHGTCIYCPGGPDVDAPQSYTGFEPSTMRAKRNGYDPHRIMRSRLFQLSRIGHAIDKLDVIVQGGTFPSRDHAYQTWFIGGLYAGANAGPEEHPEPWIDVEEIERMDLDERRVWLADLQKANEQAEQRIIGLTIETKPDWCLETHLEAMLEQGATRVELGLQTLDDDTLKLVHRGHDLQASRDAMRLARDAGFKVCVHMMPGLPGRTPEQDLEDLRKLYADPDFRPDMLKIYPTLVVQEGETTLKKWWREGKFTAMTTEAATEVVGRSKDFLPTYTRVQRIDRDIPTTHVLAGVDKSNLRQLAQKWRIDRGLPPCRCLRCREPHQREMVGSVPVDHDRLQLHVERYEASGGTELQLRLEDSDADAVVAYLRLRIIGEAAWRSELPAGSAIVRELKVVGRAVALGGQAEGSANQHRGYGSRLLQEAEALARQEGSPRIAVIAGVGVKAYYRQRGYIDLGPYVAKELPP